MYSMCIVHQVFYNYALINLILATEMLALFCMIQGNYLKHQGYKLFTTYIPFHDYPKFG